MVLTDENYVLYAAQRYNNNACFSDEEFYEDINRLKYVKRLLNKYKLHDDIRVSLVLNHIVILCNVFEPKTAVELLFLKMKGLEQYLKPFCVFLNIMPDQVRVSGVLVDNGVIGLDPFIISELRKI